MYPLKMTVYKTLEVTRGSRVGLQTHLSPFLFCFSLQYCCRDRRPFVMLQAAWTVILRSYSYPEHWFLPSSCFLQAALLEHPMKDMSHYLTQQPSVLTASAKLKQSLSPTSPGLVPITHQCLSKDSTGLSSAPP